MQDKFKCPVCESSTWEKIGSGSFDSATNASDYVKARIRILFDKWLSGEKSELTVNYLLCTSCGFITFSPRPTAEDLALKYEILSKENPGPSGDDNCEYIRSKKLYSFLASQIRMGPEFRILDFGGGKGGLMRSFSARECNCDVVDCSQSPADHINKAWGSLSDVDDSNPYDLIVCSHVFEHLADPGEVLKDLSTFIKKDGNIYIEVPIEIWKGPPKQEEPVTHLNFFVPSSLRSLLIRAGYKVKYCKWASVSHPSKNKQLVIRAIAKAETPSTDISSFNDGVNEARTFLNPDLKDKIRKAMLTPGLSIKSTLRSVTSK